jgi:hypothetical protein
MSMINALLLYFYSLVLLQTAMVLFCMTLLYLVLTPDSLLVGFYPLLDGPTISISLI